MSSVEREKTEKLIAEKREAMAAEAKERFEEGKKHYHEIKRDGDIYEREIESTISQTQSLLEKKKSLEDQAKKAMEIAKVSRRNNDSLEGFEPMIKSKNPDDLVILRKRNKTLEKNLLEIGDEINAALSMKNDWEQKINELTEQTKILRLEHDEFQQVCKDSIARGRQHGIELIN
mmetsp:Transcript_5440/g.7658  ORF Transcript_5440/g.7658 Transcript_5440/m.7658 type:complete len:175 (+) Transcript_5440:1-525(+)